MSNHFRFGKHKTLFTATVLLLSDVLKEHREQIDCFFPFFYPFLSFSFIFFIKLFKEKLDCYLSKIAIVCTRMCVISANKLI